MHKSLFLLAAASTLLYFSCEKEQFGASEWQYIEVPGATTVYSISGDLSTELIVGGNGEVYKTTDEGNSWSVVLDGLTAYELRQRGDTLLGVALYNDSYTDYYSLDRGDSWAEYPHKQMDDLRSQTVADSRGVLYRIASDQTYPKRPDAVLRSDNGGKDWTSIFPFERYIYTLYVDEHDRLYVGTIDWDWEGEGFDVGPFGEPGDGLLYILEP